MACELYFNFFKKLTATFSQFEMFSKFWSMTPPRYLGPSYLLSFESWKSRHTRVTFWSSGALEGRVYCCLLTLKSFIQMEIFFSKSRIESAILLVDKNHDVFLV